MLLVAGEMALKKYLKQETGHTFQISVGRDRMLRDVRQHQTKRKQENVENAAAPPEETKLFLEPLEEEITNHCDSIWQDR